MSDTSGASQELSLPGEVAQVGDTVRISSRDWMDGQTFSVMSASYDIRGVASRIIDLDVTLPSNKQKMCMPVRVDALTVIAVAFTIEELPI